MMKVFILMIALSMGCALVGQGLQPLDHSIYDSWRTLESVKVSPDENWVGYTYKQQQGDVLLQIQSLSDTQIFDLYRGTKLQFQQSLPYAIASLSPSFSQQQQVKRKKIKEEKQPKDTLVVFQLATGVVDTLWRVADWKADDMGEWVAMQAYLPVIDTVFPDSAKVAIDSTADTLSFKTTWEQRLLVYHLATRDTMSFPKADEYGWAQGGKYLLFTVKGDTTTPWEWRCWRVGADSADLLLSAMGQYKKLAPSADFDMASLLVNQDTLEDNHKRYALYLWKSNWESPRMFVDTVDSRLPAGYSVSTNVLPRFSADGSRLYWAYGKAPARLPEDTLGDFEKPALDVWVWDEPLLKTEQLDQEKEIRNQSYWAMSAITGNNLTLLSDSTLPEWRFAANQVGDFALASNDLPYRQERNYAYPWRRDWYKVNTNSGQRTLLVQGLPGSVRLSPLARWAVWFSGDAWVIHGLATGMEWEVTFPDITDTTHDEPSPQPPFSFGGFTERESFALFHSYSDVYAVALGRRPSSPVCLTCNDNSTIQYRVVDVRPDADTAFASVGTTVYLEGLDLTDKSAGWYQVSLDKPGEVITLHTAEASLSSLQWIRSGNRFLFRQGSFAAYPELRLAYSGQFDSGTTLSHTNPQQKDYLWGDVQLYQWSDDDGKLRDGLLYLPAGWQQDSSYPMIVYFYEKMSDELHRHYIPSPSRSTINPAWYTSNGYVVFMPDIHYTIGYPGPSALNAIVSGTRAVLADGFADPHRVGIQGQSWGGYQTAYVITQTGLYKAAMAGAPVSNMTSAYGGIRWGSGMSRQFQYERTQSRIGATLWENPHQYILNSPLFQADRINTPLLIMHNDEDGAVPWYQGVELFMAMRRLGKPAWLLNYNDEDHNLTRWPNRVDLSIRMSQFFDHYLKGASMPPWMEEGIPVDKKGITDGY